MTQHESSAMKNADIQTEGEHPTLTLSIPSAPTPSPSTFATYIHSLINMRAAQSPDSALFVYHPDNFWHPPFHRLATTLGLPSAFIAKSDDLDELCRRMLALRATAPEDTMFRLLIPAWEKTRVDSEPLFFCKLLQPFCIEGTTFRGEPLVAMDVVEAKKGLLRGVRNLALEEVEGERSLGWVVLAIAVWVVALGVVGWVGGSVAQLVWGRWAFTPGATTSGAILIGVVREVRVRRKRPFARVVGSERRPGAWEAGGESPVREVF